MMRSSRQEHQRERAFELQQGVAQGAGERALRGVRHQVEDDFGIAGGLEDGAARVPVRARSSAALVMLPLWATAILPLLQATEKGWALSIDGVAGGGVARVADGELAGERR